MRVLLRCIWATLIRKNLVSLKNNIKEANNYNLISDINNVFPVLYHGTKVMAVYLSLALCQSKTVFRVFLEKLQMRLARFFHMT